MILRERYCAIKQNVQAATWRNYHQNDFLNPANTAGFLSGNELVDKYAIVCYANLSPHTELIPEWTLQGLLEAVKTINQSIASLVTLISADQLTGFPSPGKRYLPGNPDSLQSTKSIVLFVR